MIKNCLIFLVLLLIFILPTTVKAQEMSGTDYKVKEGVFCLSGFSGGTITYNLQDIVGVNAAGIMSGSLYVLSPGFYNLNSLPLATISNYNDSRPIDDQTPTLRWVYSDTENDTQKKYQLQVGHETFSSPVVDTGAISSATTSYTTPMLPRIEERTAYKWRVRVNDGFGWSGWAVADKGFYLTGGEFLISELKALTAPGGEEIKDSTWQKDNDPYFYWEKPPEGIGVLGYSYSIDGYPDDEIDITNTSYYFEEDSITDGSHTFYVKAQRTSGIWSEPVAFNVWVDTVAPSVSSFEPGLGGVLANDQPKVEAVLSDAASGVNPGSIVMEINKAQVIPEYNLETGVLSYIPSIPFSDGEIVISLSAQDIAGNYLSPLIWSFVVDTESPVGSLLINNGDEMTTANVVTLNISAEDNISNIVEMIISNDGVFDTETWESYTTLRKNWVLPAINGIRKVYAKVKDEAGNISEVFSDEINLIIIAPDTYILSGPSGITQSQSAQFTYRASMDDCQFSYKFDNEDWSDWTTAVSVEKTGLSEGNHYFMVRAAKDLNGDTLLQLDEVDPTPALRVWTISLTGTLKPPAKPEKPIKLWEEE